ncbi:MAG: hypothetical protein IRZ32_06005 [Solirubrobacteraceae bacterium]|nr:hypothetical protein [Solirubrobacteraceae bacterium]
MAGGQRGEVADRRGGVGAAADEDELAPRQALAERGDPLAQLGVRPRAVALDEGDALVVEELPQMTIPPSTPSTWPVT